MSEKRRRQTGAALATSAGLHLLLALLVLRGIDRASPGERPARAPTGSRSSSRSSRRRRQASTRGESRGRLPAGAGATSSAERPTARVGEAAPPPEPSRCTARETATAPPARPVDSSFDALGEGAKQRATAIPGGDEALERLLAPMPEGPARAHATQADGRAARRGRPPRRGRGERPRGPRRPSAVRSSPQRARLADARGDAHRRVASARRRRDDQRMGRAATCGGWRTRTAASSPRRRAPDEPVGGPRPDVLGAYDEAARQAESGAEQRAAEVCVGVAPNHDVVVTLRRSSGNAALDRLAVDSFQRAGDARPVTPDVRPALACYRVAVSAFRLPPLPSVGIDLVNRPHSLSLEADHQSNG